MAPQKSPPHRYHHTQLIFVKNVPQTSTTNVAKLYAQYNPIEVKNLYEDGKITTLMIVLPTPRVAATALERTDGLRVDSTIISVERYNANQSTVARRETRKKRHGGQTYTNEDEYDGYEAGQEVVPDSWENEIESYVPGELLAVQREASKPDGVSWADVTKGVPPRTPSPSSAPPVTAPAVTARTVTPPPTSIATPASTRPRRWRPSEEETRAAFYPSTPVGKSSRAPPSSGNGFSTAERGRLSENALLAASGSSAPANGLDQGPPTSDGTGSSLSVADPAGPTQIKVPDTGRSFNRFREPPIFIAPSPQNFRVTSQGLTPTKGSESERVDVDSSQVTQVPNTFQQQRGSLALSTDTTAFIQNRHCADCTFCKLRQQWKESP